MQWLSTSKVEEPGPVENVMVMVRRKRDTPTAPHHGSFSDSDPAHPQANTATIATTAMMITKTAKTTRNGKFRVGITPHFRKPY